MKVNPDDKTVAAMDVLVPKVWSFATHVWDAYILASAFKFSCNPYSSCKLPVTGENFQRIFCIRCRLLCFPKMNICWLVPFSGWRTNWRKPKRRALRGHQGKVGEAITLSFSFMIIQLWYVSLNCCFPCNLVHMLYLLFKVSLADNWFVLCTDSVFKLWIELVITNVLMEKFFIHFRILEMGLPLEPYEWYLDLRRFGTVKHSGFGLGFERMILFATGLENIRDAIPFPRYPGRADLWFITRLYGCKDFALAIAFELYRLLLLSIPMLNQNWI